MPTVFKPAVDVSPLIRFGRWSFLGAGIAYGMFWQSRYTKYELSVKDQKMKEKADRDARLTAEKKINSEREMAELEAMAKIILFMYEFLKAIKEITKNKQAIIKQAAVGHIQARAGPPVHPLAK